jgi:hypothetical protein
MKMDDPVFDPKNMDTRFFVGDCRDWAIQDRKCFGINPGGTIGYVPQKVLVDITCKEGTEVTRKQFAEAYPQIGLLL